MSAVVIPPNGTIADVFKRTFADVPTDPERDNAIATTEFLEASESLTIMFDVLGSVAFTPVKNDILGNVKKLRERQLVAPLESESVQELVKNEILAGKHTAAEGLLWLIRGLEFTCIALSKNVNQVSEELADSFRTAYGVTLKPHHSFLIKPIFSAAMSAVPYRKDFYAKLGDDQDKVSRDLIVYLAGLDRVVGILKGFLETKEAKW